MIINVMYTHATHTEFILVWYVFVHIIVLPFGMYIYIVYITVYVHVCIFIYTQVILGIVGIAC